MSKIFVLTSIWMATVASAAPQDHPSEASLRLARDFLSYYKDQTKQFFPYYPMSDPYQRYSTN
jgi:hypothetical protein